MVNPREQPPLHPQPQLFSPSSDSTRSSLTGRQRDWELLPAPEPWKSDDGPSYNLTRAFGGVFYILAAFWAILFWPESESQSLMLVPSIIMITGGTMIIFDNYLKAASYRDKSGYY